MPSKTGPSDFVHLHLHTQYSLLDGTCKLGPLFKRAKEMKFSSMAITDNGNLFGAIEFYQQALKSGIKPIIGCEIYLAPKSRFERSGRRGQETSSQLVLLCKNDQGYSNLKILASRGYLDGFYYRPRIDRELLREHSKGLMMLTGGLGGDVPYLIRNHMMDQARESLAEFVDIFGKKDLYLEIQNHDIPDQQVVIEGLAKLSKEFFLPLVATNDAHYLEKQDARAHECLLCLQTQSTLDDPRHLRFSTDEFYVKSTQEMKIKFKEFPEAIRNTLEVAEQCHLKIDFNHTHFPQFPIPKGAQSQEQYLRDLCKAGFRKRFSGEELSQNQQRLEYELGVICKMGFTSYFLIVWDLIRHAQDLKIPVGPGRGSAAGSLVAYCLGITNINPIHHGLIFERFLNPDRVSHPDIDIDFCYERRDEVIQYVTEKYGKESVAQIITFGTMAARGVTRDVGRVMGLSYNEVDQIAKMIPMELNITLTQALKQEPRLKKLYDSDERIQKLVDTSRSLEGLTRHASTHAAGVVISNGPLVQHVPLFKTSDDQITTQYAMSSLEKIGLLKMDFLGLKTLTVVHETAKNVKRNQGIKLDVDQLPLDDKKTYKLLGSGEATGIFQLESSGMRDILRKLKADRFEDITAILALYRPGPLGSGMVDDYIQRRHGRVKIEFDHSSLEEILKETYGVILYQEQVMKIVSTLAGFSLSQADSLRRAMSKKTPKVMEQQRNAFMEGAQQNRVDAQAATKIFNLIEYFAGYGFNKSHSAAYAMISYQTAYLKSNFPVEFMTALLTNEKDNTDKITVYVDECRRMGIEILPPDVNKSFSKFVIEGSGIRFGLSAIKNIGLGAIESIIQVREKYGTFNSLYSFCKHIDLRLVNRKVIESLIKSGVMDGFGYKRSQNMSILDQVLQVAGVVQKDRIRGQASFFDTFEKDDSFKKSIHDIPDMEEWPENKRLAYEKELLGLYISGHPLARFTKDLKWYSSCTAPQLANLKDQQDISLGGMITRFREIVTKKGDKMAFVTLEDLEGSVEVIVFPKTYQTCQSLILPDAVLFIRGKVNRREETPKIIAEDIFPLEEVRQRLTRSISISFQIDGLQRPVLYELKKIIAHHPGNTPVNFRFHDPNGRMTFMRPDPDHNVQSTDAFFKEIETLLGTESILIQT